MDWTQAAITLAGMSNIEDMKEMEEREQTNGFHSQSGIERSRESECDFQGENPQQDLSGGKENDFVQPSIPISSTKKSDTASDMEYTHLHDSLMCSEVLEPPTTMSDSGNEAFLDSHLEDDFVAVTPRGKNNSSFSEPWSRQALSSSMKKAPKSSMTGLQSPITKASVTFSIGDNRGTGMILSSAIKHSPLVRSSKNSLRITMTNKPFVTPPPEQAQRHSSSSTLRRSTRTIKKPPPATFTEQDALLAKPGRNSQLRTPKAESTKKIAPTKKNSATKPLRRGKSIKKSTPRSKSKSTNKGSSGSSSSRKLKASTSYGNTNGRLSWSSSNDKKMLEIVTSLIGEKPRERTLNVNWQVVARRLKTGRSSKQCRDRWMNHLRPGLKKGQWTKREAKQIVALHKKLGPKWSHMVTMMPNRSENDIKNKFYSMKRCAERAQLLGESSSGNDLSDDEEVTDDEEKSSDHDDFHVGAITTSTGGKDLNLLLAAHHRINAQEK